MDELKDLNNLYERLQRSENNQKEHVMENVAKFEADTFKVTEMQKQSLEMFTETETRCKKLTQ